MPVIKVGDRSVLEAGSVVINDPNQTATVDIANLKYQFAPFASAVPPNASFNVPDAHSGQFVFAGMLPGQDYFFTFKGVGYVSNRYIDLDVNVRCLMFDRVSVPVFRVDYVFAYQPAPPPPPVLPGRPNALLGGG